jgi:hypothetical protein
MRKAHECGQMSVKDTKSIAITFTLCNDVDINDSLN